jgi:hypothetical protein
LIRSWPTSRGVTFEAASRASTTERSKRTSQTRSPFQNSQSTRHRRQCSSARATAFPLTAKVVAISSTRSVPDARPSTSEWTETDCAIALKTWNCSMRLLCLSSYSGADLSQCAGNHPIGMCWCLIVQVLRAWLSTHNFAKCCRSHRRCWLFCLAAGDFGFATLF